PRRRWRRRAWSHLGRWWAASARLRAVIVLLVRHADAESRDGWEAPDVLRPLTAKGRRQARGLVAALGDRWPIGQLVSSPSLRCLETLTPLASILERDLGVSPALA